MKKIRTFIVDDSIFFRTFLEKELVRTNVDIEIIGSAINAADAQTKIPKLKPDVITMDVEMPGLSGIEFLRKFIPQYPIPVVLVSSLNLKVFDALSAGAVDFARKPDGLTSDAAVRFIEDLSSKIRIASAAKVRVPRTLSTQPAPAAPTAAGSATSAMRSVQASLARTSPDGRLPSLGQLNNPPIIALGASTGGTEATLAVLRQLPADTPGIVIVQHMPPGFTKMYADRLNRQCAMEVREAKNGDRIYPGLALIAPGDQHMRLLRMGSDFVVRCSTEEKVSGHCPSVDVLFHSVAKTVGSNAVGIIMTGMGRDGADGLLAMRRAGAFTIGQDEASCVVYGMPMVAQNIGAVMQQTSCENIPYVLQTHLKSRRP